jgi:hypothetical protein
MLPREVLCAVMRNLLWTDALGRVAATSREFYAAANCAAGDCRPTRSEICGLHDGRVCWPYHMLPCTLDRNGRCGRPFDGHPLASWTLALYRTIRAVQGVGGLRLWFQAHADSDAHLLLRLQLRVAVGMVGLTNLSLAGCRLGAVSLQDIGDIRGLTSLSLARNDIGHNDAGVVRLSSVLVRLTALTCLDLSGNGLGKTLDHDILWPSLPPSLERLDLSRNWIGKASGTIVYGSLVELDLSDNYVGYQFPLGPLGPRLRHLRLGNYMGRCLAALGRVLAASSLETLDLRGNGLKNVAGLCIPGSVRVQIDHITEQPATLL